MNDMVCFTEDNDWNENIISSDLYSISHIVKKEDNSFSLFCYGKDKYVKCNFYLKILQNSERNISSYTCFDWVMCNFDNDGKDRYRFWLASDKDENYLFLLFIWYNKKTKNKELRSILLKSN